MTTLDFNRTGRNAGRDLEASVVILTAMYGAFLAAVIALNVGLI
ncbi:MAG: hypothetical protein AB8F65_04920 [Woeseiaceae bacterium]